MHNVVAKLLFFCPISLSHLAVCHPTQNQNFIFNTAPFNIVFLNITYGLLEYRSDMSATKNLMVLNVGASTGPKVPKTQAPYLNDLVASRYFFPIRAVNSRMI